MASIIWVFARILVCGHLLAAVFLGKLFYLFYISWARFLVENVWKFASVVSEFVDVAGESHWT